MLVPFAVAQDEITHNFAGYLRHVSKVPVAAQLVTIQVRGTDQRNLCPAAISWSVPRT